MDGMAVMGCCVGIMMADVVLRRLFWPYITVRGIVKLCAILHGLILPFVFCN